MKALFLPRYSRRAATCRLRALQYIPALEAAGWQVTVEPLLPDLYLERLYRDGSRSLSQIARAILHRLSVLSSRAYRAYDAVYIQADLMPGLPFSLEGPFYNRNPKVVVDYDDATFVHYDQRILTRNKVHRIMRSAGEVIVGNRYLLEYARQRTDRVTLLPTVVDADLYRPRDHYALNDPPVIGWVGTPVTARYLLSVADSLRALARRRPFVLRVVGCSMTMPGVEVECLPWHEDTEVDVIRSFDIGIMPLIDEPFANGKCGFKLIQYMGCGVPAVGSALGANRDIIVDGVNGFLAASGLEFAFKLLTLLQDRQLRERLGREGRRTVEGAYSLQVNTERLKTVLARVAERAA